jgi:hypothetical protein
LGLTLASAGCTRLTPYYREGRFSAVVPAGATDIDHRLLLIGDAGDADPSGEPVLELLARQVLLLPDRTTVVFLGDNVYERGMPEAGETAVGEAAAAAANALLPRVFDSREEAERRLNAEIDTVRGTPVPAIFLPGNHDWDQFEADGWRRILEQENFLRASAGSGVDVRMLPGGGCPGPVPVPLGQHGMLIALDTQWWLERRTGAKPGPGHNPTQCALTTEQGVLDALLSQLETAARQGRWAIVAGHHPLDSDGPHGGFVEGYAHLFPFRFLRHAVPFYLEWLPLPVLGSFAVVARQHFSPSPQDASNATNRHFRELLRGAMAEAETRDAPTLAYAAGHDHGLQVFRTAVGPRYGLVSGLGSSSRASEVGSTGDTLFAHSNPRHSGFMQVDFLRSGEVRLSVLEADATGQTAAGEVFSTMIADSETPRGARTALQSDGVLSRLRKRATSVWRKIDRDGSE